MNNWTVLATITFIAVFAGSYHLLSRQERGPTESVEESEAATTQTFEFDQDELDMAGDDDEISDSDDIGEDLPGPVRFETETTAEDITAKDALSDDPSDVELPVDSLLNEDSGLPDGKKAAATPR